MYFYLYFNFQVKSQIQNIIQVPKKLNKLHNDNNNYIEYT